MKGLSKGRYDETFAGEDVLYWLSQLCQGVLNFIFIFVSNKNIPIHFSS